MNPAKDRTFSRLALNTLGVFETIGLLVITLATVAPGVIEVKTMMLLLAAAVLVIRYGHVRFPYQATHKSRDTLP